MNLPTRDELREKRFSELIAMQHAVLHQVDGPEGYAVLRDWWDASKRERGRFYADLCDEIDARFSSRSAS